MSKTGPILLVEDDPDDLDVIKAALIENKVKNDIVCLDSASKAKEFLLTTTRQPFLILCDIRMQGMNGLEFRDAINENYYLRKKSIPFIFLTAAVSQEIIDEAYDMTVQGFVEKPKQFDELKKLLETILSYWATCLHPNSF